MRKEQKDIDGLGPVGMVREAFKLLATHPRFFMLIQLTLILPLSFVVVTSEYLIRWKFPGLSNPTARPHEVAHLPNDVSISIGDSGVAVVVMLLVSAVLTIVLKAVMSLSSCAILFAVGLNYTGQSVSFKEVVHASIPRLWMRLTVTNVYKVLLLYTLVIGQTAASFLPIVAGAHVAVILLVVAAMGLITIVGGVVLGILFMVADSVSVLEKDYGWAAVRKASKLLKGRVVVALLFQLLWLLPTLVSVGIQFLFRSEIPRSFTSPGSLSVFLLEAVVYICWMSFLHQMSALCAGVQYASFKAYHNEVLEESIYEKQVVVKGGYERVGGESGDTKLGELTGEALV